VRGNLLFISDGGTARTQTTTLEHTTTAFSL
jgi:hypothetical protein